MILERTENLEVLALELLADRQTWRRKNDPMRYRFDNYAVEKLFGPYSTHASRFGRDTSNIKGLQKLKEFRFGGAPLELSWCILPSLTTLRLGWRCGLEDTGIPESITSTVHTLEIVTSTKKFSSPDN
jgi:hypothetical protein